jgi:hypothetical protein
MSFTSWAVRVESKTITDVKYKRLGSLLLSFSVNILSERLALIHGLANGLHVYFNRSNESSLTSVGHEWA